MSADLQQIERDRELMTAALLRAGYETSMPAWLVDKVVNEMRPLPKPEPPKVVYDGTEYHIKAGQVWERRAGSTTSWSGFGLSTARLAALAALLPESGERRQDAGAMAVLRAELRYISDSKEAHVRTQEFGIVAELRDIEKRLQIAVKKLEEGNPASGERRYTVDEIVAKAQKVACSYYENGADRNMADALRDVFGVKP